MSQNKIQNSPAIRRMPTYLHKLQKMRLEGRTHVSSTELAEYLHIRSIVVRKDIALTGISGQRRIGYNVEELFRRIKAYLGWEKPIRAVLIGAGSLGTALLGYDDFALYGLDIEAVFDHNAGKIGRTIRGREVQDIAVMERRCAANPPEIAIICIPGSSAQAEVDRLVKVGVRYFWNFANVSLQVPPGVTVQREVIAGGLALLTHRRKFQDADPDGDEEKLNGPNQ